MMSYTGSDTGTGNPPGEHSSGYTDLPSGSGEGHFIENKSYRGDMHVGIPSGENVVGNQPTSGGEMDVNWMGKPALRSPNGANSEYSK